jgi:hypothetical protein
MSGRQDVMSKTMMFAALLLGLYGTAAHAIEMPEDLVGRWCQSEEMSFIQCEREDANLIITRNSFEPKSGSCDILSVRKSKRVKRAWIVRERCTGGDASVGAKPITTISRYTRRDVYLYVYPNP